MEDLDLIREYHIGRLWDRYQSIHGLFLRYLDKNNVDYSCRNNYFYTTVKFDQLEDPKLLQRIYKYYKKIVA